MRGNTVSIHGNITRDAEVATTANGNNIVNFGLAWNQSRKTQRGDFEDVPHYFEVKMWASDNQLRVIEDKLVKGATCAVIDGHLVQERWTDKQGANKSRVVLFVDDPIKGLLVRSRNDQGIAGCSSGGYPQQAGRGNGANVYQNGAYHQKSPMEAQYGGGGYDQRAQNYTDQDVNQPPLSVYDQDIPF